STADCLRSNIAPTRLSFWLRDGLRAGSRFNERFGKEDVVGILHADCDLPGQLRPMRLAQQRGHRRADPDGSEPRPVYARSGLFQPRGGVDAVSDQRERRALLGSEVAGVGAAMIKPNP